MRRFSPILTKTAVGLALLAAAVPCIALAGDFREVIVHYPKDTCATVVSATFDDGHYSQRLVLDCLDNDGNRSLIITGYPGAGTFRHNFPAHVRLVAEERSDILIEDAE